MKKDELINKLSAMPDNLPVWLGGDTCEGWIPLDEVFACNALDAPVDGDEVSDEEIRYIDRSKPIPEGWEADMNDVDEYDSECDLDIQIGGPIIILGQGGSLKEVNASKKYRLRDTKAERLKEIANRKRMLTQELKALEEEECNLK